MIAVVDYGASNVPSVLRGLRAGQADAAVTAGPGAGGRAHAALRRAFPGGDAFFYHVHSYRPDGVEPAADLADAEYGAPFATIVGRDAVLGVQFHPEKSQAAGLALLEGFAGWAP